MFTTIDINAIASTAADAAYKISALQATTSVELAKINANLKMIALENSQVMGYCSRAMTLGIVIVLATFIYKMCKMEYQSKYR